MAGSWIWGHLAGLMLIICGLHLLSDQPGVSFHNNHGSFDSNVGEFFHSETNSSGQEVLVDSIDPSIVDSDQISHLLVRLWKSEDPNTRGKSSHAAGWVSRRFLVQHPLNASPSALIAAAPTQAPPIAQPPLKLPPARPPRVSPPLQPDLPPSQTPLAPTIAPSPSLSPPTPSRRLSPAPSPFSSSPRIASPQRSLPPSPTPTQLAPFNVPSPLPGFFEPTPSPLTAPAPVPVPAPAPVNLDLQALLYFKGRLNADPTGVFKLWNNSYNPNPCNWVGVSCGQTGENTGRVISVSLPDKMLEGNLTNWKEVGDLSYLEGLDLSGNRIFGSIPEEIGTLKYLRVLRLRGNSFRGPFPQILSSCTKMEDLDVQGCSIVDVFPELLKNFTNLAALNLGDNSFTGTIPIWLGWSPVLHYLHLGGNRLNGDLPITLLNCTTLTFLNLSSNNLTGSVDSMVGNLVRLQSYLDLSHNRLSGRIPFELGNLREVVGINLSGNSFTGSIPQSIGNCSKLQSLDLSDNQLSGTLPETLSLLQNLNHSLNCSHNDIEGLIPGSLGSLPKLTRLDLSHNKLTGPIPEKIANMSSLILFNVSMNNLKGHIPDIGIFRNFSYESFLGNPDLCGRLVGRPCPGEEVIPQGSIHHHKKGPGLITIIGAAAEGIVLIIFAALLIRYIIHRRRPVQSDTVVLFSKYFKALKLTAEEIEAARAFTDSSGSVSGVFSRSLSGNIRRAAGFSNIEKAVLPDGTVFAVQDWNIGKFRKKDRHKIDTEMLNFSKIRHRNLVRLMGYSMKSSNLSLLMEFMPNGSLDLHLHPPGQHTCQLKWNERLRIVMGITTGLVCLHHETCGSAVVHCDLKAANVLLDSDMEPKLVDFGMARLIKRNSKGFTAAAWVGSSGYAPPEYGFSNEFTMAGDVYNYGVLILEIITGKRPTSEEIGVGVTLPAWVRDLRGQGREQYAVDMNLFQSADETQLNQILYIMKAAIMCTSHVPTSRPSMLQVLGNLQEMPECAAEDQELIPVEASVDSSSQNQDS